MPSFHQPTVHSARALPPLQVASSEAEAAAEAEELQQRFELLQRRIDAAMQVCGRGRRGLVAGRAPRSAWPVTRSVRRANRSCVASLCWKPA